MVSVILKMRKQEADFLEKTANVIDDGNETRFYHIPFYFKKVGENLFAEYDFEDLPDRIKALIEKPEKVY